MSGLKNCHEVGIGHGYGLISGKCVRCGDINMNEKEQAEMNDETLALLQIGSVLVHDLSWQDKVSRIIEIYRDWIKGLSA